MEKLAFNSLLIYLFMLLSRPMEYVPFLNPYRIILLTAILSIALFFLSGSVNKIFNSSPPNNETYWITILTLWIFITMPFSRWIGGSLNTFYSYYLNSLLLFFLIAYIVDSEERLKKIITVSLIAFSIIIIVSAYNKMFQFDASQDYGRLGGIGATLSSSNLLAFVIVLMFPLYFYSLFVEQKRIKRYLLLGITITAIFDFIATVSRGGFLGFMTMGAILMNDLSKLKRKGLVFLLITAVYIGSFFVSDMFIERMSTIFTKPQETAYSATSQAIGSTRAREGLLEVGIKMIELNPLFGVGMGNFKLGNREITGATGPKQVSHVTYIDYAAEMGIPALIIYLLLLFSVLLGIQKTIKDIKDHSENKKILEMLYISLALRNSLISYIIMSAFISIGYDFYLFFLIGLIAALRKIVTKELMDIQQDQSKCVVA
ncbi:MAG: O-antigen ligase family protein [Nitrospirota bacterium]